MRPVLSFLLLLNLSTVISQQKRDWKFKPEVINPMYEKRAGSKIIIDAAHNNLLTLDNRYSAVGDILKLDGYEVKSNNYLFSTKVLQKTDILIIANALIEGFVPGYAYDNKGVPRSAFSDSEINSVKEWVENGGKLLLIADMAPWGASAYKLAKVFGFELTNGRAWLTENEKCNINFNRTEGTIQSNSITEGRGGKEKVETILAFCGQAFKYPSEAKPILLFTEDYSIVTRTKFGEQDDPKQLSKEWAQGAYRKFGKGKIVMMGEGGLFGAQTVNGKKFGMNVDEKNDNQKLLLNIIHWLDDKLD